MAYRSRRPPMPQLLRLLVLAAMVATTATACTGDDSGTGARSPAVPQERAAGHEPADTLTVYSRDRFIAEPLFKLFEQQTGIKVKARWGDPIKLADQIIEDGGDSTADVFYGPLSDALGSLSAAGRLAPLSAGQLQRVPQAYRSPDGTWVGTAGRAHVVFYNTDRLSEDDLPDSILGFTDPAWRGRIGWDPTSRSLQDVITELRQLKGEDETRGWLQSIQVGFGSHSYLYYLQDDGEANNVAAKFYPGGEPGGLLNVAGVGIIKGTSHQAAANAFVDFMLSPAAQRYFAEEAFEIPVVGGAEPPSGSGIPTAAKLTVPGLNVRAFEKLQDARRLLTEVGVIM